MYGGKSNKFFKINADIENSFNDTVIHAFAQQNDQLLDLSNNCRNPEAALRAMRKSVSSILTVQKKMVTRDTIDKLLHKGTNDANRLTDKFLTNIIFDKPKIRRNILEFLMKTKLKDAQKDLNEAKKQVQVAKDEINKQMNLKGLVANEFGKVQKMITTKSWMKKRKKMLTKVNFHSKKHQPKMVEVPSTFREIRVGNEFMTAIDTVDETNKIGETNVDEDETKILNLPPKHTIYEKITVEDCEVNLEECFAKMRWDELNGIDEDDENKNEQESKNNDVVDEQKKTIDFRKMRATDMPCNKGQSH